MQTVLSIIGTRPEGIKMAPVVRELASRPEQFRSVVCVTGQHRQMLDQVLDLFAIRPDIDLNLMKPNQTLSGLTADAIASVDRVLTDLKPDWVLAQGDTTTVLAGAMACFYRGIRFGHVEAGLRTGDMARPFPEEFNRRVADLVASLYFAPTQMSRDALLREGVPADRVLVTGNTVIDALLDVAARPYAWQNGALSSIPESAPLVLVTAHRRESFGEPFRQLCMAIRDLADRYSKKGYVFVYPVHLNPNVRGPVQEILGTHPSVRLIEPVDYASMVRLMMHSAVILTDSGGIQEEAPSLGVPVLVMRDTTERPEGIAAGVVRLVGTDRSRIVSEVSAVLEDPANRQPMRSGVAARPSPYGDGQAARRIVNALAPSPQSNSNPGQ